MFSRKSALEKILLRGRNPEADIGSLLAELDETPVKTTGEAEAICDLLKALPDKAKAGKGPVISRLYAIAGLFHNAETKEAFGVLAKAGVPELCRIFDQCVDTKDEAALDDLLFVLKILAMYRTEAGTDRVIRAARMPLKPDSYMWTVVLGQYDKDHPHAKKMLGELSRTLPPGFLAVALLDCANGIAIDGGTIQHPFDSTEGIRRLQAWLTSRDEDEYSYARSVAASIPFIRKPDRERLLALALDHPSAEVQMEGAWASAKLGNEAGLKMLVRYCLDVNHSERARRYLTELGREDAVPAQSLAPDFRAKAEFAQWLAHPNELGRSADELDIVDHRELAWPPEGKRKPFWLIKYRVKDTTGLGEDDIDCGLVGSVTFCLFSYKLAERPPEDAYAIHCYWEMKIQRLIREIDVKEGDKGYDALLRQWGGEPLKDSRIVCVAELSAKLKYPQKTVAIATATLGGNEGWAVLDGKRSTWYSKHDMPEGVSHTPVLMLHVGRKLLGFQGRPDRRKFLMKPRPKREPQEIIKAYEKLLAEAIHSERKKAFDSFTPLGEHFEKYVDALVTSGRMAQVPPLIETFAPHWEHNSGYGKLGAAAFRCGRYDIAERYFTRLRQSYEDWPRCKEMSLLAEIWLKQGRVEDAHCLLVECLKRLLEESKTAGSDERCFEDWFQHHRSTYLRLFPDRGDATLGKNGVPPTTRR